MTIPSVIEDAIILLLNINPQFSRQVTFRSHTVNILLYFAVKQFMVIVILVLIF